MLTATLLGATECEQAERWCDLARCAAEAAALWRTIAAFRRRFVGDGGSPGRFLFVPLLPRRSAFDVFRPTHLCHLCAGGSRGDRDVKIQLVR